MLQQLGCVWGIVQLHFEWSKTSEPRNAALHKKSNSTIFLACEAGERIKPGALAPGQRDVTNQARETGESLRFSSFRPLRGLRTKTAPYLGLTP